TRSLLFASTRRVPLSTLDDVLRTGAGRLDIAAAVARTRVLVSQSPHHGLHSLQTQTGALEELAMTISTEHLTHRTVPTSRTFGIETVGYHRRNLSSLTTAEQTRFVACLRELEHRSTTGREVWGPFVDQHSANLDAVHGTIGSSDPL